MLKERSCYSLAKCCAKDVAELVNVLELRISGAPWSLPGRTKSRNKAFQLPATWPSTWMHLANLGHIICQIICQIDVQLMLIPGLFQALFKIQMADDGSLSGLRR